jgi:biotin transport system substrate-specific component
METVLKKDIVIEKHLFRVLALIVFVVFTSLGAFVRIPLPFTPVPITLQTFFVLLSGALLGGNLGVAAQLSYAFLGLSGLPIFTGAASGMAYLLGPTGGYIFGFVLSALFVGRSIKYCRNNLLSVFCILFLGDLIILSCGVIWLKLILGHQLTRLLYIGFIPFIPGDLIKVGVASILYSKLKSRFEEAI